MENKRSVTIEDVEATIGKELYWHPPGTRATVCCLVLKNGFSVTGEAHCVDDAFYSAQVGKEVSRSKALEKIWPLLGYQAREAMQ